MSFSFEFYAHGKSHAMVALQAQQAPEIVKVFIISAISGLSEHSLLHIKAQGHLMNGDYNVSNCDIRVTPIKFWEEPAANRLKEQGMQATDGGRSATPSR